MNDTTDNIEYFIWRLKKRYAGRIKGEWEFPATPGEYCEFPQNLHDGLRDALQKKGIHQLYRHQRDAWDSILQGNHTVVVTPTASGKTLCYNLPVLQAVLSERVKSLYLFPTKALSQDQVAEILELNQVGHLGVRAYTFDGDTPGDARKAVRVHGDIVVSNPDMLHQGILPHHTKWAQFFECLKYIVIDEMHIYRGVFGSHMANLMRRLMRICRFYNVQPTFILCSATIANPDELAAKLIGERVATIDKNGAPTGKKTLLLWNPPVINPDLAIRASARSQTTRIARMAIKMGFKTIIFSQTRLMVEVITKYLKDVFDKDPRRPAQITAYRGGYLPTERRQAEQNMRRGKINCVVTTSALELGVDIGALDVCILNGYPGTIAGTWQRLGRAGRRLRPTLGVIVATSQALDQFIIRHTEYFIHASPEHAYVDTEQLMILLDHVRCAAFELPFNENEKFGRENLQELLSFLQDEGVLHKEGTTWYWMTDQYPANSVSLRSVAEGNFVVVDTTSGQQKVIAEVDYTGAPMTLYEGAIYMIQAQPWQVEKLDWDGRKAFVTQTRADYYTDAIDYTKLKILEDFEMQKSPTTAVSYGEVHISRRIAGYKKIRYYTHENVGYGKINLPDQEMHTTAVWWQVAANILEHHFKSRWQALDGFLGAAYAMHHSSILLSMSELRDLGRAVGNGDATWFATIEVNGRSTAKSIHGQDMNLELDSTQFKPTVFLYDNYAGGIGLSAPLFDMQAQIIQKSIDMVAFCSCSFGCPACVGPVLRVDTKTEFSPKTMALLVLKLFQEGAV